MLHIHNILFDFFSVSIYLISKPDISSNRFNVLVDSLKVCHPSNSVELACCTILLSVLRFFTVDQELSDIWPRSFYRSKRMRELGAWRFTFSFSRRFCKRLWSLLISAPGYALVFAWLMFDLKGLGSRMKNRDCHSTSIDNMSKRSNKVRFIVFLKAPHPHAWHSYKAFLWLDIMRTICYWKRLAPRQTL